MYHPTTRVLAVLELLQSAPQRTGADLAERLEVDIRTVRRYIEILQDLGIPVEGGRGRYGGYRLKPGFKLPPLLFTDDEALALTLGLLAARRLGLTTASTAAASALAKVERVLPMPVRERVRAVEESLALDLSPSQSGPSGEIVLTLSAAARDGRRVWLRYRSGTDEVSERDFDTYGLVYSAGHWYAAGYCHLRQAQRTFRLDRVQDVALRHGHFERPADFDTLAEVARAIASVPREWPLEVLVEAPLDQVRRLVAPRVASLEAVPGGTLLSGSTGNLAWMARYLSALGFPFAVRQPPQLREALRQHALTLAQSADRDEGDTVNGTVQGHSGES
jgi:predicted DNA-binding transcriptional regulator YafY